MATHIHFHPPPPPQQQQQESSSDANCRAKIQELLSVNGNVTLDESSPFPTITISIPTLKYGYRNEPAPWTELVRIIQEDDLARLSRSESQQREYEIFRYYLKLYYKSIVDFVLCTKFGIPMQWNEETKLWQASSADDVNSETTTTTTTTTPTTDTGRMVLVPNDFPYSMQPGIIHYILWKRTKITPSDIEEATDELKKQLSAEDIVFWVNPPNLKSLPEIDHVHFLCLLN
jgi:hypothetical protein